MPKVRIGVSTIVVWLTAAVAAVGAAVQVLDDRAPWLVAVSAVLVALNNGFRSWQAVQQPTPLDADIDDAGSYPEAAAESVAPVGQVDLSYAQRPEA